MHQVPEANLINSLKNDRVSLFEQKRLKGWMMKKGKWVEDKLQQLQKNPESYFLKGSKKPFVLIFEHSFEHFSSFRKGFSLLSYFLHPGVGVIKQCGTVMQGPI